MNAEDFSSMAIRPPMCQIP